MLETVVFVPDPELSAATNASRSSFAAEVVKAAVAIVFELLLLSFDTILSMASSDLGVTVSVVVWLTPP